MKKRWVFLFCLTLIFGVVSTSQAMLMEYVFEKGSDTWVLGVDLSINGFMTQYDGDVLPRNETTNIDAFFADYYSGPLAVGGGIYTGVNNIEEYNYGWQRADATNYGIIQVGSQDSWLTFYAAADVSDWVAGSTAVRVQNKYTNPPGSPTLNTTVTHQNVLLAEIRSVPAPEPATMILLGVGLVGLAGFGRKKLIKQKK